MGQMDRAETGPPGGGAGTPATALPHFSCLYGARAVLQNDDRLAANARRSGRREGEDGNLIIAERNEKGVSEDAHPLPPLASTDDPARALQTGEGPCLQSGKAARDPGYCTSTTVV